MFPITAETLRESWAQSFDVREFFLFVSSFFYDSISVFKAPWTFMLKHFYFVSETH